MTDSLKKLAEEMRAGLAGLRGIEAEVDCIGVGVNVSEWIIAVGAMQGRLLKEARQLQAHADYIAMELGGGEPGDECYGNAQARALRSIAGEAEETE